MNLEPKPMETTLDYRTSSNTLRDHPLQPMKFELKCQKKRPYPNSLSETQPITHHKIKPFKKGQPNRTRGLELHLYLSKPWTINEKFKTLSIPQFPKSFHETTFSPKSIIFFAINHHLPSPIIFFSTAKSRTSIPLKLFYILPMYQMHFTRNLDASKSQTSIPLKLYHVLAIHRMHFTIILIHALFRDKHMSDTR